MNDELLYLFTGSAEIFIKNRMNRIIQSYQKQKVTIIKYDMETTSLGKVLIDAITVPLLEDVKIIIMKRPRFLASKESLTNEMKEFIKYLKKPSETTVLMIDATGMNIPTTNEIYKALKNYAMIVNYSESEEIEVKGWIVRTLSLNNIEIKDDALNLFLEYLNNDQIRMEQELDKISLYLGPYQVVTTDIIKQLVPRDVTKQLYLLVKAIVSQNTSDINNLYQDLVNNTKDTTMIVNAIINVFKELLTTSKLLLAGYSQSDIAKFYGITPGFAYYKVKDAKTFDINDLACYLVRFAKIDYQIKSGQIDKNIGIELLITNYE